MTPPKVPTVPLGQLCPRCNEVHERCRAHKKSTGGPCRRWPQTDGVEVCRFHGGTTPQAMRTGAARAARTRALGVVGELLAECEVDTAGRNVVEALTVALDVAAQWVAALGIMASGLDLPALTGGDVDEADIVDPIDDEPDRGRPNLYGPNHLGDAAPHVIMSMYGEWLDRYARLVKIAADLGMEDRRQALKAAEQQGVAAAIMRGLVAVGADTPEVRQAIAAELRTVATLPTALVADTASNLDP